MARHIRKGDMVEVLSGKYKGRRGKVLEVLPDRERVRVEGVALVRRHLKAGRDPRYPNGGIVDKLGTIHWSNVLPIDPKTDKPTRVGFKRLDDGRKVRVARRSGELLSEAGAGA